MAIDNVETKYPVCRRCGIQANREYTTYARDWACGDCTNVPRRFHDERAKREAERNAAIKKQRHMRTMPSGPGE